MIAIKNTLFVGKVLKYFESASSTNALAAEWLQNGQNEIVTASKAWQEGVVFFTFHQTAGRGQYGNKWKSEPHQNIAISIVLTPSFLNPREQFHLNKAISLAIYDIVSQFVSANEALSLRGTKQTGVVSIKWANDIYIKDKKVAGILIQNSLSGANIQSSIIGIGLNVNQLHFPNLPHATSLKIETGKDFDLMEIIEKVCQSIEHRYLQLKTRNFNKIHDEYISKLYRWGEDALYQYPDGTYFQGKIVGVNEAGKLCIESKKGIENFDIKEVKFVID